MKHLRPALLFASLLFPFFAAVPLSHSASVTLHISPTGNDSDPGTVDKPFATLTRARDALRALKKSGPLPGPVTVLLQPGVYPLAQPLVFTPEDSGCEQTPITWRGVNVPRWPAKPDSVLTGAILISGWQRDGKFLKTNVRDTPNAPAYFTQLYVNGHRRARARGPNTGAYFRPDSILPGSDSYHGLVWAGDQFKRWSNLDDVLVVMFSSWFTTSHFIESLDEQTKKVRFTARGQRAFNQYEPNPRFYVENVREYLDEPGEWFLDRSTGTLLYLPLPGESADTLEAWAPATPPPPGPPTQRRGQLLQFQGEPEADRPIEYLSFQNLALRHTDTFFSRDYSGTRQAEPGRDAALYARGLRHSTFLNLEIAHTGEHGMLLHDGCRHNTIRHCLLHDLGGGGICAGGTWRWGKGDATYAGMSDKSTLPPPVTHNVIENNLIRDGGHVFHGVHGIWLGHASHHSIRHNEISDLPYSGISAGWDWSGRESTAHHNTIEFNHIHRIGLGILNDLGGIYTLGDSPGTVIRDNLIHDIGGYQSPISYVVSAGIYLDKSTGHLTVSDNVVHDVVNCAFFFHHDSFITCENNVFARFTHRPRHAKQRDDACVWAMFEPEHGETGNSFRHNIVYGDVASLVHYRLSAEQQPDAAIACVFDENFYRHQPGAEAGFTIETGQNRRRVSLEQWQAAGNDSHSRFGEPGFVDPGRNDFTLTPDAPARALGVRSIDLSQAGLVGEDAWRALPASFTPRRSDPPTAYQPPGPKPPGANETYEDVRPGFVPDNINGPVTVVETGSSDGKHALRFADHSKLQKSYWPIRTFTDFVAKSGQATVSFDFFLPKKNPALFRLEARDWRDQLLTGPRIDFLPAGKLVARDLSTPIPLETWCHIDLSIPLGADNPRSAQLTLKIPNKSPVARDIPFIHRNFEALTWLGLSMPDTKPGAFFIDNLNFSVIPTP